MDIIFVVINFRCVCHVCLEVCVWFCGACVGVSWSTGTGQSADVGLRGSPGEREREGGVDQRGETKLEKEKRAPSLRASSRQPEEISSGVCLSPPRLSRRTVRVGCCLCRVLSVSGVVCVGICLCRWLPASVAVTEAWS